MNIKKITEYLPTIGSLLALVIVAFLVPWGEVLESLKGLTAATLIWLIVLSMLIYAARAVRLWYLLKYIDIERDVRKVGLAYMAAQPLTFLPAGEVARAPFLSKYVKIPERRSIPTIGIQALIEAVALIGVSLMAALVIGRYQLEIFGLFLVSLIGVFLIKKAKPYRLHRQVIKLPFVNIGRGKFAGFIKDNRKLLKGKPFAISLLISTIPVLAGSAIFYISAREMGFELSILQSIIGFSLPLVIGGISFLPGGVGAVEGASVAILALFGVNVAAAIAITLLVRIFTWGIGFIYGGIAGLISQILHRQPQVDY